MANPHLFEPISFRSVTARNRIAIAIPCHRVIASDGKLSGYRWGINRKEKLLQRESAGSE